MAQRSEQLRQEVEQTRSQLEDALEELRMNLHARHAIGHRGRAIVRERDRGDTDQHQLVLEPVGFDGPGHHVRGRDESRRIVAREVNPHTAIALARDAQVADAD